ncbi:MAG: PD-(D/E)XK nuclease family protein [Chloracidobacterium sp.]|nr:PD-(D/E)XK nuclease family protein [Chloracidobacterium sp.]MDW8218141.1 PD-(D/E)XK nuclease family protein [Acidobacteriota bacterium]
MPPQREIWRGPLLGKQRDHLLAAVRAFIQQGRAQSVLYLTASRPMLDAVSRRLLDGQSCVGSFDGLPVYLFNGFIRRLLRTALLEWDGRWQPVPRRRDISGEDYPMRRPLIAQIMRQLAQRGRLPAFGALATAGGCVASVTKLIGEITRAGKTAAEFARIVEQRIARHQESLPAPDPTGTQAPHPAEQVYGYERDVARIAQCYAAALEIGGLTENDYDYLRAIAALDGELDGSPCRTPFLEGVEWIIVDGFFDFTPVQGEILRRLVARAPRITFNFDDDVDNPQVFAPVQETIAKVKAMGEGFTEVVFHERAGTKTIAVEPTAEGLDILRHGLFNPSFRAPTAAEATTPPVFVAAAPDVERELRHLAKTIKQYVTLDDLTPSDIAIVVRDKEAYGPHLRRILSDEGIAYTLDERLPVMDVPAVRAWLKLLAAAMDRPSDESPSGEEPPAIPVGRLIDVLKSDYFAVPDNLLTADDIENVVAFVGDQLRLDAWLKRAQRLAAYLRRLGNAADSTVDADQTAETEAEAATSEPKVHPDAVTAADLDAVGDLLRRLGRLIAGIPLTGTAEALLQAIEQTLAALSFESRLETDIRMAVGQPRRLLQATLDLRGLQAVRRAVAAAVDAQRLAARSIAAVLGGASPVNTASPTLTLAAFQADILRALDGLTLRVEPETFGAVRILEATTVRGLHFPVIFVPGLVEGGFPIRLSGDWIYPAAEREQLKEDGLTLEDLSPATLAKEEHYFYQAVCRATQAVHLSYPTIGAEDEELSPSSFLAEIGRLVPETQPGGRRHTVVPKGYDGASLLKATTKHELLRQTAAATARLRRGAAADELLSPPDAEDAPPVLSPLEQLAAVQDYLERQGWFSATLVQRQAVEQSRYSRAWTPFDGHIESADLREELAKRFGERYVFSATALNEYAACPFRFFAHRVLRLRPRVSAALDLQAVERGRIVHDILRDVYRQDSPHAASPDQQAVHLERLHAVANAVFDAYEQRIPPLNTRLWAIEKRVLLTYLEQLLIEEMTYGNAAAHVTELAFGMQSLHADPRSKRLPLRLTGANGEIIQLRGQIDRIDILEARNGAEGQRVFVVYDYKLSKGPSVRDMLEGRDVQIAVYLAALANSFPEFQPVIGGGYFAVAKTPRCHHGLYLLEYESLLNQPYGRSFISREDFEATYKVVMDYVWKYQAQIKQGRFDVFPARGIRECASCDFSSVCRYETYRIRRKVGSPHKTQRQD